MGTNVSLTPELERFAREVVAEGRYNNVSEVVRDGLRLLQDAAERKKSFMRMVGEVEADVEKNGSLSIDEAMDMEVDRIIDETERAGKAAS